MIRQDKRYYKTLLKFLLLLSIGSKAVVYKDMTLSILPKGKIFNTSWTKILNRFIERHISYASKCVWTDGVIEIDMFEFEDFSFNTKEE